MNKMLKISVYVILMVIPARSFSQSARIKHEHRDAILIDDPVRKSIDSLRNLFSGFNLAIQANPANSIYNRQNKILLTNRAERTTANCSYFCNNIALPVTGLQLEGERINERIVQLKWKTYTETNNLGFDIERSFETGSAFTKRAFVAGTGNTTTTTNYQSVDPNDFEGISFYRLRQVDADNNFRYSNVVIVKGFNIEPSIIAFPNPGSNNATQFRLSGFKVTDNINIIITDMLGRVLVKKTDKFLQTGPVISLNKLSKIPSGFYTISAGTETKKAISSFVVTE